MISLFSTLLFKNKSHENLICVVKVHTSTSNNNDFYALLHFRVTHNSNTPLNTLNLLHSKLLISQICLFSNTLRQLFQYLLYHFAVTYIFVSHMQNKNVGLGMKIKTNKYNHIICLDIFGNQKSFSSVLHIFYAVYRALLNRFIWISFLPKNPVDNMNQYVLMPSISQKPNKSCLYFLYSLVHSFSIKNLFVSYEYASTIILEYQE